MYRMAVDEGTEGEGGTSEGGREGRRQWIGQKGGDYYYFSILCVQASKNGPLPPSTYLAAGLS